MRFEFAGLLTTLSDNLILGIENDQNLNQEQISQVMSSLFDIIQSQWIISKDSKVKLKITKIYMLNKVRSAALNCLGYLFYFLSEEKIKSLIEPFTQLYSAAFKKENKTEFFKITEGFNKFLEKLLLFDKTYLESLIKSLVVSMHSLFMSPIFSSNIKFDPIALKFKNELLRSIQLLAKFNVDSVFDHFLGRLNV